jgi:hypothetical protein
VLARHCRNVKKNLQLAREVAAARRCRNVKKKPPPGPFACEGGGGGETMLKRKNRPPPARFCVRGRCWRDAVDSSARGTHPSYGKTDHSVRLEQIIYDVPCEREYNVTIK